MTTLVRTTDRKGRVSLPTSFADSTVLIELIGDSEVRIRKARVIPDDEVRFAEESGSPLSDSERDRFLALLDDPPPVAEPLLRAIRRQVAFMNTLSVLICQSGCQSHPCAAPTDTYLPSGHVVEQANECAEDTGVSTGRCILDCSDNSVGITCTRGFTDTYCERLDDLDTWLNNGLVAGRSLTGSCSLSCALL